MTFEVEIDGATHTVSVEGVEAGPEGGRFRVRLDGALHELDARPTNLGLSIVRAGDGRSLDVAITDKGAGQALIQFPHGSLTAVVDGRRARRSTGGEVAKAGEQRVVAPMPGRVVRILVKPGDDVAVRQGLVVIEAMKMENELTSPKAGRVKDVAVSEGASVEAGRLLVVVE